MTMQANVRETYGGPEVLRWTSAPKPGTKPGQVLIRVAAASVNAADLHLLRGEPLPARLAFGLFKPKFLITGADVAGTVEAVGEGVTRFKPGDRVFGDLSGSGFGAYAELAVAPEKALALVPDGVSLAEAASAPMAACTALQAFRKFGEPGPGSRVLVTGASGGVGSFAVQIARELGAHVTAVTSTPNVEQVRNLGAAEVIDRHSEDFRSRRGEFDLVIDTAGRGKLKDALKVLRDGGKYVLVGGDGPTTTAAMMSGRNILARPNLQDLEKVAGMLARAKLRPLLGRTFPLHEAAEAMRAFEAGGVAGKIVLTAN